VDYAAANNTSLYDPTAPPDSSGMTRIASPSSPADTSVGSLPNDLFCARHLQLPNGNVLFAGGTQNYYPGELFRF